jgi:hypothetical protein
MTINNLTNRTSFQKLSRATGWVKMDLCNLTVYHAKVWGNYFVNCYVHFFKVFPFFLCWYLNSGLKLLTFFCFSYFLIVSPAFTSDHDPPTLSTIAGRGKPPGLVYLLRWESHYLFYFCQSWSQTVILCLPPEEMTLHEVPRPASCVTYTNYITLIV